MLTETQPNIPQRFDPLLPDMKSDELKAMSRLWGGKGTQAKDICIRLIKEGLANPAAVKSALFGLNPADEAALVLLKEHGGIMMARDLCLQLQAYGYPLVDYRYNIYHTSIYNYPGYFIEGLVRRGLLMKAPGSNQYGLYSGGYYGSISEHTVVFSDERILAQLENDVSVQPLTLATINEPVHATVRRPQTVLMDIMTLLQKLAELKKLQLTKAGALRAADLRSFAKKMGWEEDQPFDGQVFPNVAFAFLHALWQCELLHVAGEVLELRLPPEQFMHLPLAQQVATLAAGFRQNRYWHEVSEVYYNTDFCLHRSALFYLLYALPTDGRFMAVDDLLVAIYNRIGESLTTRHLYLAHPNKYGKSEREFNDELTTWRQQYRRKWLEQEKSFYTTSLSTWLYWLGLVELGATDSGVQAFRLTDLARQVLHNEAEQAAPAAEHDGAVWVVQPNYDIIVYLDVVSPAQLAFLERHAERRQAEQHTAHYVLTRESVYQGLQSGTTPEGVLQTLCDGAGMALPQNVEREICEWAQQREQITLRSKARLIEFPSSDTRELAMDAGLKGTRVGECYVLVEADTQVKAALKAVFGLQLIPAINYAEPPVKCLDATEDGTLTLKDDTGDMLIAGQLARCAEQLSNKKWRLTPASLQRVRQAGVNAKTLLTFLASRTLKPLPPLLEIAIRNAFSDKGTLIQADAVFVLHIKDKKLYDAITDSDLLKPYLLDVPGPDTIVVSLDKLEEFKQQLDWLGIKLAPYAPDTPRPDWQQTLRDAKATEKRRGWW